MTQPAHRDTGAPAARPAGFCSVGGLEVQPGGYIGQPALIQPLAPVWERHGTLQQAAEHSRPRWRRPGGRRLCPSPRPIPSRGPAARGRLGSGVHPDHVLTARPPTCTTASTLAGSRLAPKQPPRRPGGPNPPSPAFRQHTPCATSGHTRAAELQPASRLPGTVALQTGSFYTIYFTTGRRRSAQDSNRVGPRPDTTHFVFKATMYEHRLGRWALAGGEPGQHVRERAIAAAT